MSGKRSSWFPAAVVIVLLAGVALASYYLGPEGPQAAAVARSSARLEELHQAAAARLREDGGRSVAATASAGAPAGPGAAAGGATVSPERAAQIAAQALGGPVQWVALEQQQDGPTYHVRVGDHEVYVSAVTGSLVAGDTAP